MKTIKNNGLDSWKCGKDKAFTHIPTHFIVLFKTNSIKNHTKKERRKSMMIKSLLNRRFWRFSLKKLLTLPLKALGGSMKKIILLLIVLLVISLTGSADVYIKNMKKTSEFQMMGKTTPEKVEIEEQWLSTDRFAIITKDLTIIGNYQEKQVYFIVHKLKQYYQFPTEMNREKLNEILPPKIAEAISTVKVSGVKVTTQVGKKKVANWNCRGNDLEMTFIIPAVNIMPQFKIRMWVTKDLPFDYKKYVVGLNEFFGEFIMKLVNIDEAAIKEMEKLDKIEGFQVAGDVTLSIFGAQIKAESQVLELVEKKAPTGIYKVPEGYKPGTLGSPQK